MKKVAKALSLGAVSVVASITLASCTTGGGSRPLPRVDQTPTVEGKWVDPNGFVSTFQGGVFTTQTTDTNQVLASGNYTMVNPRLVEINMTSRLRNTQLRVNCAMATDNQLNCTSESGSQFSLVRQQGAML